jgi:hypothetical protein
MNSALRICFLQPPSRKRLWRKGKVLSQTASVNQRARSAAVEKVDRLGYQRSAGGVMVTGSGYYNG